MSSTAAPMRLIVTGAAGFIGRQVVAQARRLGMLVRPVVRSSSDAALWCHELGVEAMIADMSNKAVASVLDRALEGADAVIHAAGAMAGGDTLHARNTVIPTEALIKALANRTTREGAAPMLVLVSSVAVYGYAYVPFGATLDETTPCDPDPHLRDAYCRAKLAQEALAVRAAQELGLQVRIMRLGTVFGPGRLWTDRLGFAKGPFVVCIGGGAPIPAVHVDCSAKALVMAASTPSDSSDVTIPHGPGKVQVMNVVSDDLPDQASWLDAIRPWLEGKTILRFPAVPLELAAYALSPLNLLFPELACRIPSLLREPALSARIKPLRYSNARLKDRLHWEPARSFQERMRASLAATRECLRHEKGT